MNSFGLLSPTHRQRYKQVISVLAKYGFDELQSPLIKRFKPKDPQVTNFSRWERIRLVIEELGGAFIKVGQILSNRPDLLPPELLVELEKLQDKVQPFPTQDAIKVIEAELNQEMADVFLMFDEEVLASASISQVYRAVLLDGTPVVIKVLRPGIESQFKVDLDVLSYLSEYLARIPLFKSQFKNQNPVKDLRAEIENELNFSNEAANIRRFSVNFQGDPRIVIPKTYPEYCTQKVLTMDYISGIKVTDIERLKQSGYSLNQIADNLIDLGLKQIFEHRFFHGDPHPGNILVLKYNQIAYLDFGLMGQLSIKQRQNIIDLITAFSQKDAGKISRLISKSVSPGIYLDVNRLETDIDKLLGQYTDKSLKDIHIGQLVNDIMALIYAHNLTMSSNNYLLVKAAIAYEGIGRKLVPEFDISARSKLYAQKLLIERLSPQKLIKDFYSTTGEAISLLRDLPKEARNVFYLLQSGRLTFSADIVNAQQYLNQVFGKIDQITNRIAYTIVLASMILGSAIALRASVGGDVGGIPIFAAAGFIISAVMGLILLVSILRRGAL